MITTIFYDIVILILLIAGHAFADYPLGGDFLSQGKNTNFPDNEAKWYHVLTTHSAMHGGIVFFITTSPVLGVSEFVIHWITDCFKYFRKISVNIDQEIHIGCKLLWWIAWIIFIQ